MIKFGRKYRLTVETNDGGNAIVITDPITINFTLTRAAGASLNTAEIAIYNLGKETRGRIFKDSFNPFEVTKEGLPQRIVLEAGYGELTTVFSGNIWKAYSSRNGVNVITNISSRDGGFDVTRTTSYRTMRQGSTIKEVIQSIIGDFPYVKTGILGGDLDTKLQRPAVINGNSYEEIQKYADGNAFIDLEKLYILKPNEVYQGDLPLISAATGLLGTPRREDSVLIVTTLFEPRILMGQLIELQDTVAEEFNGTYKVIGVQHQGTISGAEGGRLQSTFTLLTGSIVFGGLKEIAAN